MSGKISTEWDEDIYGNSLLLVRKNRGKLNLDEVLDAIRYDWRIQGHYVMILNATEATCGVGWDLFGEEKKGDEWELYKVEEGEKCPVCNKVSPLMQYCPECGHELLEKHIEDRGIRSKSKAILDAIIGSDLLKAHDEESCLRIIDKILKEVLK
nr:MAG TPA: putative cytoplasmic protein [Caudoviricetes sp.]